MTSSSNKYLFTFSDPKNIFINKQEEIKYKELAIKIKNSYNSASILKGILDLYIDADEEIKQVITIPKYFEFGVKIISMCLTKEFSNFLNDNLENKLVIIKKLRTAMNMSYGLIADISIESSWDCEIVKIKLEEFFQIK